MIKSCFLAAQQAVMFSYSSQFCLQHRNLLCIT